MPAFWITAFSSSGLPISRSQVRSNKASSSSSDRGLGSGDAGRLEVVMGSAWRGELSRKLVDDEPVAWWERIALINDRRIQRAKQPRPENTSIQAYYRPTACSNQRCTSNSSAAGIGAGPPALMAARKALQQPSCPLSCDNRRRVRKPGMPQAWSLR